MIFFKILDFYREGFSAVKFDCNENNFRIGNVNLSDALKLIEEITAPGVQVENDSNSNYIGLQNCLIPNLSHWDFLNYHPN